MLTRVGRYLVTVGAAVEESSWVGLCFRSQVVRNQGSASTLGRKPPLTVSHGGSDKESVAGLSGLSLKPNKSWAAIVCRGL